MIALRHSGTLLPRICSIPVPLHQAIRIHADLNTSLLGFVAYTQSSEKTTQRSDRVYKHYQVTTGDGLDNIFGKCIKKLDQS